MSNTMLTGVLRAPAEPTDLIAMIQLIGRAKQAADEIDSLRQQLAQAQADVARLREALNDQLNDCINFDDGNLTDSIMERSTEALNETTGADAFIRCKQAEAVESLLNRNQFPGTSGWPNAVEEIVAYVQRLRGEVEE